LSSGLENLLGVNGRVVAAPAEPVELVAACVQLVLEPADLGREPGVLRIALGELEACRLEHGLGSQRVKPEYLHETLRAIATDKIDTRAHERSGLAGAKPTVALCLLVELVNVVLRDVVHAAAPPSNGLVPT
jgi:hypothetical protein